MDSLAANPGSSSSSIYGQPQSPSDNDTLKIVNQLRNRELDDFKNKANFMADLSLKQEKLRDIFKDPALQQQAMTGLPPQNQGGMPPQGGMGNQINGMNVVHGYDSKMSNPSGFVSVVVSVFLA